MKNLIRPTAIFLAVVLLAISLSACSSMGKPVMTLEGNEITENMYRLWLSRVKGSYGGSDASIWDQTTEEGKTYNEIFTGFVRQNALTFLSALHEFDRLGLKLPKEKTDSIDKTMKEMLKERAGGNKDQLNSMLSAFGVNYDILREIYVIEEKLAYLKDYLYGENGTEVISENLKNEYYTNNYVRIKQIFFYTANKPVTDENGKYVYDESGNVTTRSFTDEELAEQKKKASGVMTSLTAGQDFDLMMASQNEDTAALTYPGGYYFTRSAEYVDEVIEAAFQLGENEFTMVESEYGIHIIKRLPLEEAGYTKTANADFFSDFEQNLETEIFTARLAKYEAKIKINEELIAKYDVKSSAANTIY